MLHALAAKPDSILVSAETVKDYQLHSGDTLRLRLIDARTGLVLVTVEGLAAAATVAARAARRSPISVLRDL